MLIRLFLLILWCSAVLRGAEADALIQQANDAETAQNSRRALELFQQADKALPNNPAILQKIARQYSDLVLEQPTANEKKRYAQIALDYAQRAVTLDPKNPVNVLSLAVCHGKLATYSDTRNKVAYSRLVREESERALSLDDNYAWAHHVLGRWHCEVANLGSTSRFFVKLFYGDLPPASVEEGIKQLKRATELEPTELNHWLELGFAYLAASQPEKARIEWTRGLSMPSRGIHDEPAKQRAREALEKLN